MEASKLELVRLSNATQGESVIFIGPADKIKSLTENLSESVVVYGFTPEEPDPKNLLEISESFKNLVVKEKLTRLTLVGVGWGGTLAIHYSANNIKNVRRVIFFDAVSRPKQLPIELAFEWIERFLPLGLPFRPISKDFDPRPIIHRVRCPVLVITENQAANSDELDTHAKFLMNRLPNAWQAKIALSEFSKVFDSFISVPTKQPQKALRGLL